MWLCSSKIDNFSKKKETSNELDGLLQFSQQALGENQRYSVGNVQMASSQGASSLIPAKSQASISNVPTNTSSGFNSKSIDNATMKQS